ncbi:MAG: SRPBCC domain-containing protein, partial [Blastocatellia bacterium]
SVDVIEIEENRKIVFDWTASGVRARVTIALKAGDSNTTLVAINETGWPMDRKGVQRALGQTQGWTDFLCCMKAYLQHGVNLRLGRVKKGANS